MMVSFDVDLHRRFMRKIHGESWGSGIDRTAVKCPGGSCANKEFIRFGEQPQLPERHRPSQRTAVLKDINPEIHALLCYTTPCPVRRPVLPSCQPKSNQKSKTINHLQYSTLTHKTRLRKGLILTSEACMQLF